MIKNNDIVRVKDICYTMELSLGTLERSAKAAKLPHARVDYHCDLIRHSLLAIEGLLSSLSTQKDI